MSSTNKSQLWPHEYGDGSNGNFLSSKSSSSFSNDQEQPEAPGGFENPMKTHERNYYLHPCSNDIVNAIIFVDHYLHHASYLIHITCWFRLSSISSNFDTKPF